MNASRAGRWAFLLMAVLLFGCAGADNSSGPLGSDPSKGYVWSSPYRPEVKSVYVEMFGSRSFRRDLEFRLTKALMDRIQAQTPYRLAGKQDAQTVLYGQLRRVSETVLSDDYHSDLPQEKQVLLVVDVTWKDLRTGKILLQRKGLRSSGDYFPPLGESFFHGSGVAIERMAESIVELMMRDF